jgi:hypothetical protein
MTASGPGYRGVIFFGLATVVVAMVAAGLGGAAAPGTGTSTHSLATASSVIAGPAGVVLGSTILTTGGPTPAQHVGPGMSLFEFAAPSGQVTSGTVVSVARSTVVSVISVNHGWLMGTATNLPVYVRNGNFTGWLSDLQSLAVGEQLFSPTLHGWILVSSVQIVHASVTVIDLQTTGPNDFVANGVLVQG